MFDAIRKHNKIMMILLFLLIIPSFVMFGLGNYRRDQAQQVVASVDGISIPQQQWDTTHQAEVRNLRASIPNLDVKLLDSPQARYASLERLVRDKVFMAAGEKLKLSVSDQRLARELRDNPAIAALRQSDGSLDLQAYRQLLRAQGMTPQTFEEGVRTELSAQQVTSGVLQSGFVPAAVADLAWSTYYQRRQIQVARFNSVEFLPQVQLTQTELEQFLQANARLFMTPEQIDVEYVVLDIPSLEKGLTPPAESELKTLYEQNLQRLTSLQERRASHILVAVSQTATAAERQKAQTQAQELWTRVKKEPALFAQIARQHSQDPGSAQQGGDLGFFARGTMTKPFEEAVFALKKGQISDVVASEFGYHIIMLADIKEAQQRSYADSRAELMAEVKKQQVQKKYAEVAEAFSNAVYEQSQGLKPIAQRFGLELKTVLRVQRDPLPGAVGPLAQPKFLQALFSADAVQKKRNTEAIELAANQLVAGRVLNYTAAKVPALAEVRSQVEQRLRQIRAAQMAHQEAQNKLAAWKAHPERATLPETLVVARNQTQQLPAAVVEAAMRVDAHALPQLVEVDLGAQGHAIVKVTQVLPREAVAAEVTQQDRSQYAQWWNAAESWAYYEGLKQKLKVQIKVKRPTVGLVPTGD